MQDERIRLTTEMLRGMRAVKMLAWEGVFVSKVLPWAGVAGGNMQHGGWEHAARRVRRAVGRHAECALKIRESTWQ
eukprot:365617-Chlamydomonas_euryale.AAC.8